MPKFNVTLSKVVHNILAAVVEVEAANPDEAKQAALAMDDLDWQYDCRIGEEEPQADGWEEDTPWVDTATWVEEVKKWTVKPT